MTPERIAELDALEKAATPAPWIGDRHDGTVKYCIMGGEDRKYRVYNVDCKAPDLEVDQYDYKVYGEEDTDLTMAARNALPELLADLKRYRAALEQIARVVWDDDAVSGSHEDSVYWIAKEALNGQV